ncbi:hypothetical protein ANN_13433 [Periplaneta americana]|uniref:Uncharacterized protein n=1 Tax=Periplaneta americana TaxID=6978 RepID=A0ABQ8TKV0_PERAM|nr:hypothetical protein ANN_13433 [Periplaneta americana]
MRDSERIPNLTGEQSDGITVFRIPPMTSLMLHRCRTGAISLQSTDNNLYSRHDSHRSFQQFCSLFRCNVTSLMPPNRLSASKLATKMYQLVPSATGWLDGIAPLLHRHNNTDELKMGQRDE